MEKDLNMSFAILGIEITKDENLIRSAYRMALPANNPEDNPEGFKSLREAYENALTYSRMPDDGTEQIVAEMMNDDTPMGAFMRKLTGIYKSISARINPKSWEELLKDEVFDSLDDYEEAKWTLFGYLAENYRIPREIYILLNEHFHISENEQEFKEQLPVGFVDFMLSNITNTNGGYSCKWMSMLRGADEADYDAFLSYFYELEREISNPEKAHEGDLIKAIDALEIWHPYYALDKADYLLAVGQKDEAADIIFEMADAKDYKDDLRIQMLGGYVLWRADKKDEAYELLCRSLEISRENYIGNKYCALYEMEHGEIRKALPHIYTIRNLNDDEELREAADKIEKEFIVLCEKDAADGTISTDDLRLLVYAYGYQGRPEKAIEVITSKPSYEKAVKGYHMLLSYMYKQMNDYENARKHGKLRLESIKEKLRDLEAGVPLDEDDTRESLMGSLSDANLQLGLFAMTGAKNASMPMERVDLYKEAAAWLKEACDASDVNFTAWLNLAYCYMETRAYKKAYEIYDMLIKQLGVQNSMLFLKQRVCYEMGNAQEVIDLFYRLLENGASEPEIYEYAARVFLDYRQLDDAKGIFEKADAAEIKSYGLRALWIVYNWFSNPADDSKTAQINMALDGMLREGEQNADDLHIADYLAELYYVKAMHVTQFDRNRISHLRSAIEVNDRAKYRMALAGCLLDNSETEEALAEYLYIEKNFEPGAELYLKIARCCGVLKDMEGLRKYLERAVALGEEKAEVYKRVAITYDEFSCYGESIELWRRYVSFEPEDIAFALYRYGYALLQLGRNKDAIAEMRTALNFTDKDGEYDICVNLGRAYLQCGENDKGVVYVERSLASLREDELDTPYALSAVLLLARTYKTILERAKAEALMLEHIQHYTSDRLVTCVRELKEFYAEWNEYEKALALLERYQKLFTEAHYAYLRLDIKYRSCLGGREKRQIIREIERAFRRYGTQELRELWELNRQSEQDTNIAFVLKLIVALVVIGRILYKMIIYLK